MAKIVVTAVKSDFQGNLFVPAPGSDLESFWHVFENTVNGNSQVDQHADVGAQDRALRVHLRDHILPNAQHSSYTALEQPVYHSRWTDTGWVWDDPGVSVLVVPKSNPVLAAAECCFGIQ